MVPKLFKEICVLSTAGIYVTCNEYTSINENDI